mgnify:CR=1 FL=1
MADRRRTDQRLALPRPIPVLDSSREIGERDTDRRAVVGFERQRTAQRIDTPSELPESESASVLEGVSVPAASDSSSTAGIPGPSSLIAILPRRAFTPPIHGPSVRRAPSHPFPTVKQ